jgi:hypothetical protein
MNKIDTNSTNPFIPFPPLVINAYLYGIVYIALLNFSDDALRLEIQEECDALQVPHRLSGYKSRSCFCMREIPHNPGT